VGDDAPDLVVAVGEHGDPHRHRLAHHALDGVAAAVDHRPEVGDDEARRRSGRS
jgi:hypothetical protein